MRFGIEIVPFGEFADPRNVLQMAETAEASGWEGVWLWDHLLFPYGSGDLWVMLAAIAAKTRRLKLVSGVAALPRYRPHILARLLTGLDLLSEGRFVLGAGSGAIEEEFTRFGEPGEARVRAEMLDEGLDVITRLWSGEPVEHTGSHYTVAGASLMPKPIQQPRIPVWIGGESRGALRRVARWDGWIVGVIDENSEITLPPEKLAVELAYILERREGRGPFEVAVDGVSQPGDSTMAQAYAEAGATWWFESLFGLRGSLDEMLERIKAGPPAF
jgi:alkanesulfonate monooxygenase SsuD/methylene tetrahydromethanopterin reductase-like flavin-dependent oxidoreductase (luciferase family)